MTGVILLNKISHYKNDTNNTNSNNKSTLELKLTSPLLTNFEIQGILTKEFKLTEAEESLILDIVKTRQLAPSLTLFDLLCYDLIQTILTFTDFVSKSKAHRASTTLCVLYYAVLGSKSQDTSHIKKFLKTLQTDLVTSSNIHTITDPGKFVEGLERVRLINTAIFPRIEILLKFIENDSARSILLNQPISMLQGYEKNSFKTDEELNSVLTNNSRFLWFICLILEKHLNLNNSGVELGKMKDFLIGFPKAITWTVSHQIPNQIKILNKSLSYLESSANQLSTLTPPIKILSSKIIDFFRTIPDELTARWRPQTTPEQEQAILSGQMRLHSSLKQPKEESTDMLSILKTNGRILEKEHLVPDESGLLEHLFKELMLDSKLSIVDFLFFALCEKLEVLKSTLPLHLQEEITETQASLSALFLQFSAGSLRETSGMLAHYGPLSTLSHCFLVTRSTFELRLNKALNDFKERIETPHHQTRSSTKRQKEALKKINEKYLAKFDETITPVKNLILRFFKMDSSSLLMFNQLALLQGSEVLDQESTDLKPLKKFWNFVEKGYDHLYKHHLTRIAVDFNAGIGEVWKLSSHPSENEISLFFSKIVKDSSSWNPFLINLNSLSSRTNDPETLERIATDTMIASVLKNFTANVLRVAETRLLPKGTLTTEACFLRFVFNAHKYDEERKNIKTLPSTRIQRVLMPLELQLKQVDHVLVQAMKDITANHGSFDYPTWIPLLYPHETPLTLSFNDFLKSLASLKEDLLQDFKSKWSSFTYEKLLGLNSSAIKEDLFNEALPIVRPLLLISDMLALLQKRRYSEESAIIPKELADVMQLDELDAIIKELIVSKTPPPTPAVHSTHSDQANQADQEPVPVVIDKSPQVKTLPKLKPSTPTVKKSVPPSLEDLKHQTKSRIVLDKLQQMGFLKVRQTGSHHILRGPERQTVVVPNNNNLPLGTLTSIIKQASSKDNSM